MKQEIKLILLDLDGTLLNSRKEISAATASALARAAEKGILIVPCTGRFYGGMPEAVRALPYLKYAITINGAEVYDDYAHNPEKLATVIKAAQEVSGSSGKVLMLFQPHGYGPFGFMAEELGSNLAKLLLIAINGGYEGGVVVENVKNGQGNFGFNIATGEYVDMIKAGIVDPVKVTRSALQNASSVAAMVLTTESLVADKPDPAADAASAAEMAAAQGGGMY